MKKIIGVRLFVFLFSVLVGSVAFADHVIDELEGNWHSTLFNNNVHYLFHGIEPHGESQYLIHHVRGNCIGSGMLNLRTGYVRTVETCPSQRYIGEEDVYLNIWRLVGDHGQLHLDGGYYSAGSSTFKEEDLDKNHHEHDPYPY